MQKLGYDPRPIFGTEQTVIAAIGDERTHHTLESLNALPQVEKVMPVQKRYKLVSRESHPGDTVINVDGVPIGGAALRPHGRAVLGGKRRAAHDHRATP